MSEINEAYILLQKAQKKMKSFFPLFKKSRIQEASELYQRSAVKFKLGKHYTQAGDVYIELAEITEDIYEKSKYYEEAGMMFRFYKSKQAIESFIMSAKLKLECNLFTSAAKMWILASKIHEDDGELEKAIIMKLRACNCYEVEKQDNAYLTLKLDISDMCVKIKDYKKAISNSEAVINEYILNTSLKYSTVKLMFNNLMYYFITDNSQVVNKKLDEYIDKNPLFENTREHQLIIDIISSETVNEYTTALRKYDNLVRFSDLQIRVLTDVKKKLFETNNIDLT